jgi:hypothetical protein
LGLFVHHLTITRQLIVQKNAGTWPQIAIDIRKILKIILTSSLLRPAAACCGLLAQGFKMPFLGLP